MPIRYICKGPRFTEQEAETERTVVLSERTRLQSRGDAAAVARIDRELADPLWRYGLRKTGLCNQTDLTALIAAVPADGLVHDVTCPTCGTITSVRKIPEDPEE